MEKIKKLKKIESLEGVNSLRKLQKSAEENDLRMNYVRELLNSEEILERTIVGIGDGAHINIPKKHLGKQAKVVIKRKEDNTK